MMAIISQMSQQFNNCVVVVLFLQSDAMSNVNVGMTMHACVNNVCQISSCAADVEVDGRSKIIQHSLKKPSCPAEE